MNVNSISDLARQHMLSILGYAAPSQTGQAASNVASTNSNQLSPFAQMLSQLQQLEQSNSGQYTKLTQQISTNLSAAASTAQTRGNSSLASQLTTLSQDFSSASQSGQLPNVNDLETLMKGAGSSAAATAGTAATLPSSGSHSKAANIIGQVLSLAGI